MARKEKSLQCLFIILSVPLLALSPVVTQAQGLAGGKINVSNVDTKHVGDNMVLSLNMNLDSLKVRSNSRMVYTPVVRSGNDSVELSPIVINGRNQQIKYYRDNGADQSGTDLVVRRDNGKAQTVSYTRSTAFQPWMDEATVSLREDECGCGDIDNQRSYDIATIDNGPKRPAQCYIKPAVEARKERFEKGSAFIDFVVNKTDIRSTYRNNASELEKITKTIDLVRNDKNVEITGVDIHGYASPEGSYGNNTRLARERAAALKNYVAGLYDLPSSVFTSNYTPEDWDGLRSRVAKSDIANKQAILNIIDGNQEPDAKDNTLRQRFPEQYRFMLDTWYPALRHSDYTVSYTVKPFSVEEAKEIMKTKPQQLSLEEMYLVAQTYEPGSPEFDDVFETAVRLYPDDPTANLNAACTAINNGQLDRAEQYLVKAGDTPQANEARAILKKLKEKK